MTQLSAPAPSPSVPKRPSGRYIDFVARPKTAPKTGAKTVPVTPKTAPKVTPKPASKPSAPTPIKAVPRQRHIMPKGLRMDFVRRPKDAPLPEIKVKKTVQVSVATSAEAMPEMTAPSDDDLSLALAGFADDDDEEMPSLTDNRSREANDFEDEIKALDELDDIDKISDDLEAEIADFVDEPKPMFEKIKKPDAPDANGFSLGGRSPFLTSVKVEKRPLSGIVPDEVKPIKKEANVPLKNAYRAKIKQVLKSDKTDDKKVLHRETTIVSTPQSHAHNISLAIAILLTIILGGLIGAVVYLIFFQ